MFDCCYELKKLRVNLRSGAGGNMLKREPRRPISRTWAVSARDLRQRVHEWKLEPTGTELKTLSCLSSRNVPVCAIYEIPASSTISKTVIVLGEGARELCGIPSFKARY